MRLQKRLIMLLTAVLFLFTTNITAYAHEVPDFSKNGTISITMTYDSKSVSGGSFTLYQVGAVKEDDGDYSFVLTDDFAGSGADLTDVSSEALAAELKQYAGSQMISGRTEKIRNDGKVSFTDLKLGLYLLVQNEAADGYSKVSPFLVSVPMKEEDLYVYDIDASPKVELEKEPGPLTPTKPENPVVPTQPVLPQTGQLNWPIPVLVMAGMILFAIGWILRFGRRKGSYEN